jgi:hypothetical protein
MKMGDPKPNSGAAEAMSGANQDPIGEEVIRKTEYLRRLLEMLVESDQELSGGAMKVLGKSPAVQVDVRAAKEIDAPTESALREFLGKIDQRFPETPQARQDLLGQVDSSWLQSIIRDLARSENE